MTDAYIRHDPRTPIALVLDSPHSGEWYPDDFDHLPPREIVRRAEDTHVARLWRNAVEHGATLLEARFPRAYIDANRSLEDIDADLLSDQWQGPIAPSRKTAQGIGLVWRLARGGTPMYGRKLTSAEVRTRIDNCWHPYHAALDALIDERHRAFGAVWHVNCHSCRPWVTPWPTTRGAIAPISCSAIATARRASPRSPRSSQAWRACWDTPSPSTTRTRAWSSCASTVVRPSGATACSRAQAHAVHGRGHARAERRLRASSQRDLATIASSLRARRETQTATGQAA
jgi:hypothetical protein